MLVTLGGQSVTVKKVDKRVWTGFKTKIVLNKFRTVEGLPVEMTLEALGYKVNVDENTK